MKSCYLCGNEKYKCRKGKVRDNESLDILECTSCGLVRLSDFSHIEKGFYQESGMHKGSVDIEKWLKATKDDDESRFKEFKNQLVGKSVLDFGCGNGGFLLQAKNVANQVAGVDLDKSLVEHFKEQDIKFYSNIDDIDEKFDVITMFHVIEHLKNPHSMLKELSKKLNPGGKIIVETPNSNDALLTLYKSKAFREFTYWSCHLYLFNQKTLGEVIKKSELKTKKIYQKQRYPLSNHLYWLLKGKPGGHKKIPGIDKYIPFYGKVLSYLNACDTIIAEVTQT